MSLTTAASHFLLVQELQVLAQLVMWDAAVMLWCVCGMGGPEEFFWEEVSGCLSMSTNFAVRESVDFRF